MAIGAVKLRLGTSGCCLSRPRPRVRVPSSPPFIPKELGNFCKIGAIHKKINVKRHPPTLPVVTGRRIISTTLLCALRFLGDERACERAKTAHFFRIQTSHVTGPASSSVIGRPVILSASFI